MKRLISLVVIVISAVLSFSGCSVQQTFKSEKSKVETCLLGEKEGFASVGERNLISENEKFRMFYSKKGISVENKADKSVVWKSYVDEESFEDFATSTETWKNYMQSIISVTYISKNSTAGNFNTEHSSAKGNTLETEKYSNGLKIKIDYAKSKITLAVEITLDDKGINVRIPAEEIKENGDFYLYSAEIFPFLNAGCPNATAT